MTTPPAAAPTPGPAATPTPDPSPQPMPVPASAAVPVARGVRGLREARADVRRRRLVDAQLGPDPAAAGDDAGTADPRRLRDRARSLWCSFVSGLG